MRRGPYVLIVILAVGIMLIMPVTLWARTPTPNEVEAVARTLYCPLCVGERLDACEIPLCQDMKKEIARQLAEGRTPEEIRAYFVEQYGPVVLGEPPRKGINWLAWVIPVIVLIGAAAYALFKIKEWSRSSPEPQAVAVVDEAGSAEDEYAARVERELAELE